MGTGKSLEGGGVPGHDESVSHRPREEMLGGELENCVGRAKCAFLGVREGMREPHACRQTCQANPNFNTCISQPCDQEQGAPRLWTSVDRL